MRPLGLLTALVLSTATEPVAAQYYGGPPPPVFVPPFPQYGPAGPPGYPGPSYRGPPPGGGGMGMRCATPYGMCFAGGGPIGAPCSCQSPAGLVPGQLVP